MVIGPDDWEISLSPTPSGPLAEGRGRVSDTPARTSVKTAMGASEPRAHGPFILALVRSFFNYHFRRHAEQTNKMAAGD